MAWPTRSKLLGIRKDTNHNAATRLTIAAPPASHTYLVKQLTFSIMTGGNKSFLVYIERGGTAYLVFTIAIAAGAAQITPCNLVLEFGDSLTYNLSASHTGDTAVSAHGANLG